MGRKAGEMNCLPVGRLVGPPPPDQQGQGEARRRWAIMAGNWESDDADTDLAHWATRSFNPMGPCLLITPLTSLIAKTHPPARDRQRPPP
jgi:hypothetical protein